MSDLLVGFDWDLINQDVDTNYTEITYSDKIRGYIVFVDGGVKVRHKRRDADTKFEVFMPFSTNTRSIFLGQSGTSSLGFFATEAGSATLRIYVAL